MHAMLRHFPNRRLPVYLVQIFPAPSPDRVSPDGWRPIIARDFQTAAVEALRRGDCPDWQSHSRIIANVARAGEYRHANGIPLCSHRIELEIRKDRSAE